MRPMHATSTAARRIAGLVGVMVGCLLALVLLVVGGTFAAARTSWGSEQIRRWALPRVNDALLGHVELRRFRFLGNRIVLEGLSLRDPEGRPVAQAQRLDVAFSPFALLRKRLVVQSIACDEPTLWIRQEGERGTNLSRALGSRHPNPKPETAAPRTLDDRGPSFAIDVESLSVDGAVVDLRDERPDGAAAATAPALRHVHVAGAVVRGHVRYDGVGVVGGGGTFDVRLEVRGNATEPIAAPVSLAFDASGHVTRAIVDAKSDLSISIGDSSARVVAHAHSQSAPARAGSAQSSSASAPALQVTADVERVRIMPSLVRLFASPSPIKVPLTLAGRATWDGGVSQAAFDLQLKAAGGTVTLQSTVDLARQSIDELSIRARALDLGRLMDDGPPSDLALDVHAHGQGHSLGTLRGAATVEMPRGRLGGYPIGPARLRVDADRGHYKVMDLVAMLPGIRVSGAGEATARAIAFRAAVDARDLGATAQSLTIGRRAGALHAHGRGRIDITLAGNPDTPALHVDGHLVALSWQDLHVPRLDVSAEVPNIRTPLAATLDLRVPQADAGARRFRGLTVKLRSIGPRVDAHVALTAPESFRFDLAGAWAIDHTELVVDQLSLASRHAIWKSVRPMRLVAAGDVVRVVGLDLRSEHAQELRLDLEKRGRTIRADVALTAVDLSKLPESLLPPKLRLAGRLSATARIQGHVDRPSINTRATLADGRIGDLRAVAFDTDVRLANRRVSGRIDLGVLGAKVTALFDVPAQWPPPAGASLAADVGATGIDIQRVMDGLGSAQNELTRGSSQVVIARSRPVVRGNGSIQMKLSGTGRSPQLALSANVHQLEIAGIAAGDFALTVDAPGQAPIAARLELTSAAAKKGDGVQTAAPSVVAIRSGFTLGALIHHRPTLETILATRLHVEASVDRAKLSLLAALSESPRKIAGTLSLQAVLDGAPQSAEGHIGLSLAGVRTGRFPTTDGTLNVELGAHDVHAHARVTRRDAVLAIVTAHVKAPVKELRMFDKIGDVPIDIHATLGPLDLQRVGLPPETDRRPPRVLKGAVRAQLDLTGTLRAPHLKMRADASDVRMDQTPLGGGTVMLTYADRKASADVDVTSARLGRGTDGRLHLVASANTNLGYPAIARGIDPRQVAITARFDAQAFDIAGLSGVTPGLRTVAGRFFAGVDVTGTAADPRPSGRAELKDGAVTVTGMGEYKRIHLLAHGDKDHLVLDELRADSGAGHARATGSGDHLVGNGYAAKVALDLDKFPAYVDGQALAAVSLRASADAQVSVQKVRATVSIGSARLALSDAKRKHLQKLARPDDVVLVDGDAPLNPMQANRLAAVNATLKAELGSDDGVRSSATDLSPRAAAGVVVTVNAPRNCWVSGKDANLELGLQPGFRVEVRETAEVFGQVVVKRGRVDVVGRRFDLKADSTLRFAGPPDAPELDVSANHVNERENITVLVTVKGTPGHLQIGITAPDRPDLTETQLYTLIVTGRLTFGGGTASATTPTDRAASLVGGLLASQLQKSLSSKLPFDLLTIEAGSSVGAAKLEAGRYLTADLYVGYVGRLGADPALLQNRNAVHLEYELTSRWSFEGEYGDAKTGSADVMWTKRY